MAAVSQQWACSSHSAASAGVSGGGSASVREENKGTLFPVACVATSSPDPFVSSLAVRNPATCPNGVSGWNRSKRSRCLYR